jgi:hypothetical protein
MKSAENPQYSKLDDAVLKKKGDRFFFIFDWTSIILIRFNLAALQDKSLWNSLYYRYLTPIPYFLLDSSSDNSMHQRTVAL